MDGHRWGDSGACGAPRGPDLCSLAAVSLSDAQALRAAAPGGAGDFAPAAVCRAGAGAGGDGTNRLRPAYGGDRPGRRPPPAPARVAVCPGPPPTFLAVSGPARRDPV